MSCAGDGLLFFDGLAMTVETGLHIAFVSRPRELLQRVLGTVYLNGLP